MTVERLAVRTVTPYEVDVDGLDGRQYEQVAAVATIALDPDLAANARISIWNGPGGTVTAWCAWIPT